MLPAPAYQPVRADLSRAGDHAARAVSDVPVLPPGSLPVTATCARRTPAPFMNEWVLAALPRVVAVLLEQPEAVDDDDRDADSQDDVRKKVGSVSTSAHPHASTIAMGQVHGTGQ